jgi:hypothetical protein
MNRQGFPTGEVIWIGDRDPTPADAPAAPQRQELSDMRRREEIRASLGDQRIDQLRQLWKEPRTGRFLRLRTPVRAVGAALLPVVLVAFLIWVF